MLLGAQLHQIWGNAVGMDAEAGGRRGVELGELLGHDRVEPEVARRRAAVGLGDLEPGQALLACLDPDHSID